MNDSSIDWMWMNACEASWSKNSSEKQSLIKKKSITAWQIQKAEQNPNTLKISSLLP